MTHHDARHGLQELPNSRVVAGLAAEFVSMSLPEHLLQFPDILVVYPYPDVGRFEVQS